MKYLISISYDGSKYYGFQRLEKKKTVQGELENVLKRINKTIVYVKGAGRTDRGVHALDQKVHFDLTINIDPDSLVEAMNSMLEPGIYVSSAQIVDEKFHARYDAQRKIYQYVINLGKYNPIMNDYLYNYNRDLNIKAMKKASKYLIGMHSYEAFTSGTRNSYNSIIYRITFKRRRHLLYIRFEGKSFYRYMVRNLVGALILVGRGKITPEQLAEMLAKKKNIYNYMTVPASGLYLEKVEY